MRITIDQPSLLKPEYQGTKPTAVVRGGLELPLEILHPDYGAALISDLTYKLPKSDFGPDEDAGEIHGYVLDPARRLLIVPRTIAGVAPYSTELTIQDCRCAGRVLHSASISTPVILRNEKQHSFVDPMWERMKLDRSVYGVAGPGTGKTVMAIELLRRYGRSAAVVVHKDFLMTQWRERFKQFWPGASVGWCQQDHCDTGETHDIVLCMVQSMSRRDYPRDFWNSFGVVVFDEAHRMGSEHWNPVIYKFSPMVFLMLSATPSRKDGLHDLQFLQTAKPTVVISTPDLIPRIETRRTGIKVSDKKYRWNGRPNWSRLITALTDSQQRNDLIVKDIVKAAQSGRKVLVISERLNQLAYLETAFRGVCPTISCSQYIGGKKRAELDAAARAQVIFTTYQLTNEGLDIPELSVLIVASPRSDLIQAVGRILRMMEEKQERAVPAIVVDYQDDVPELHGVGKKRRRVFDEQGFDVRPLRG